MNYTYCEKADVGCHRSCRISVSGKAGVWGWDISALKQLSKQIYRQMVSRNPGYWLHDGKPLRVCLTGGILWLSIYKAAEEKMSEKVL